MRGCLEGQGDGSEVFSTSCGWSINSCDKHPLPSFRFVSKGLLTDGKFPTETSENPVLVMFMWASGAIFEAKLNQYENDPNFSPQLSISAIGANGMNDSFTNIGIIENGTVNTPTVSTLPSSLGRVENSDSIDIS